MRRIISSSVIGSPGASASAMNPYGIYQTLKCRIFDSTGEVVNYCFTTNPTWQMIETLLRFQIKPQQPPLAGLSASERACFDWPAIVAHAARNATLLSSGAPTYAGNFAFAADAKLAAMMETQLRNCRSYKRVRGGQISFIGDDSRTSVFTVSQRNMVGGSLKMQKKDLSTSPNVYVPQYRDLGIPAVAEVSSVTTAGSSSSSSHFYCVFDTVGQQPFFSSDSFTYSGGTDDADFAGDYQVIAYATVLDGVDTISAPPIYNSFNTTWGPQKSASATGGYLGTQQSRFSQRAPTVVQHRSHQKSMGQIAPGITPVPRAFPVQYDMGNNTFDQTNRIMQFMMARDLGTDGANWVAPFQGSVSLFLEAVDALGNAAAEIEDGDVIALDTTAAPDFAGLYEVLDTVWHPPSGPSGQASLDLTLQTFNPNAFIAASDPPGQSYLTLASSLLPMGDFPGQIYTGGLTPPATSTAALPFVVMQATPTGGITSDGTVTLSLPDLSVWWQGQTSPTAYSGVSLSEIPANTPLTLYLVLTDVATTPTMQIDTTNQYPPEPIPFGSVIIYYGSIAAATGGSGGGSGGGGGTSAPLLVTRSVALGAGLGAVVYNPSSGFVNGAAVSSDGSGS